MEKVPPTPHDIGCLARLFRLLGGRRSGAASTPPKRPREWVPVWAEYAKNWYEYITGRVDEFRNRARQLVASVLVVVGLELAVAGTLLKELRLSSYTAVVIPALALLLGAIARQLILLHRLIELGYGGTTKRGPEGPANRQLIESLSTSDEIEAERILGAYYAKASEELYLLSEHLGANVRQTASALTLSLWFFVTGGVALAALAALTRESYTQVCTTNKTLTPTPRLHNPSPRPAQTPQQHPSTRS